LTSFLIWGALSAVIQPTPVRAGHQLEVGLGDDPPIADHDHRRQAEAPFELVDLGLQRLVVVQLAAEHLDRDRPPRPVAE
jgi:hypothetical protein